jgi:hypothetical protein
VLFGQHPGAALAEAHRPGAAILLHLANDEDADCDDQKERKRIVEHQKPDARAFLGLHLDVDAALEKLGRDLRVGRSGGPEVGAIVELAGDDAVAAGGRGHGDRADIALVDLADEFRIRDRLAGRCPRPAADHLNEQHKAEEDAGPDQHALHPGVRRLLLVPSGLSFHAACESFTIFPPR